MRRFLKDSDEAEWIAKNIEALHDEGYNYGEIAILYRMNVLSRGMEQALLEKSIPYNIIRGVAFYERAEVKDALSMLRLAVNPLDMVSLARAANIPARGIGKTTVGAPRRSALEDSPRKRPKNYGAKWKRAALG